MSFKTIAEFLAQTGPAAPTAAERHLIAHCHAGTNCVFAATAPSAATAQNTIRAPLLRLLILGATPTCRLHDRGVALLGAWIEGELDLSFCTARGQTVLNACHFTQKPSFVSAKLKALSLEGSHLPGLFAQGVRIEGSVFLRGLTASGTVDMLGAKINGQLACDWANLNGAGGTAMNVQGAETGDSVFLRSITSTGSVVLVGAKIGGQLGCDGAQLDGNGDFALQAQGLKTGDSVYFRSVHAIGTIDVNGAKIGGQLSCKEAKLDGAGGMALNAQGMEIGQSILLRHLTAIGTVALNRAKVGGQLDFQEATLDGAGREALIAQSIVVSAGFFFRNLKAVAGRIDLSSAHVGDLVDGEASWPTTVDDLILEGFTYERLVSGAPVTLSARRDWLAVGSSIKGDFRPQPYTQFARVLRAMGHTGEARKVLFERDCILFDEANRADRIAFATARDGDQTKRADMGMIWARLHLRRFWSWLSRIVVGHGHKPERAVGCIAFLTISATLVSWLAWIEGSFAPNSDVILTSPAWQQVAAIGCVTDPKAGCDPNPAQTWADDPARGMDWDSFNAIAYAADLVVPLIDLGQTQAWAPSKDRGWLGWTLWWGRWVFIFAGWVVASLGLAAVTGFVQKNAPD